MTPRYRALFAAALATCALVAGGLVVTSSTSTPPAQAAAAATPGQQRPNVVFVLTDDLSRNLVKYMPHVVGLQKAGTSFDNYSVTDSLCCPSRSSIFSGRFPHDTGVFTNTGDDGGFHVFHGRGEESSTFGTDLQSVGYRTAMMGKYMNGYLPQGTDDTSANYVPPGWDEWDVAGAGYAGYNYTLNANGSLEPHGKTPADYLNNVLSGKAQNFVRSSASAKQPFMLEVATFTPHAPYTPAPRDVNTFPGVKAPRGPAYDRLPTHAPSWLKSRTALTAQQKTKIDGAFRKRVQAVQSVDRMIGDLQATLTQAGVAQNTVIVFSSDNGYHMGQYRLMPGKMTAFDTDVNVPLIAAGAGIAHRTVTQPAENIDLRPTFDELAGASTPAEVDGRSLVPLLQGRSPQWRRSALVEHHGPDHAASDPDLPGKHSGNPPTYNALRTTRFTYVEYVNGQRELYDRRRDPHELHNVVGSASRAQLARMHRALAALTACHGQQSCWTAGRLQV